MSVRSDSTESTAQEDKFGKLLKFPEDIAPVFDDLSGEQKERRLLDFVRNLNVVRHLNAINDQLDIASAERRESDVLLEKLSRSIDGSFSCGFLHVCKSTFVLQFEIRHHAETTSTKSEGMNMHLISREPTHTHF